MSIACFVAGGVAVFVAANFVSFVDGGPMKWSATLSALGASLMAVGALALTFELTTRRSVMKETLAATQLSDEIRTAGLTAMLSKRNDAGTHFSSRIGKSKNIDLMFVSASTWLKDNRDLLESMLKGGGRVRLLIPDPSDDALLSQLLSRFDYPDLEGLRTDVRYTFNLARNLAAQFPERPVPRSAGASSVRSGFAMRRLAVVPTYSLYKVDHFGLIRVHEVRKPEAKTHPVLVFSEKGHLDSFAMADFDFLWNDARAISSSASDQS